MMKQVGMIEPVLFFLLRTKIQDIVLYNVTFTLLEQKDESEIQKFKKSYQEPQRQFQNCKTLQKASMDKEEFIAFQYKRSDSFPGGYDIEIVRIYGHFQYNQLCTQRLFMKQN